MPDMKVQLGPMPHSGISHSWNWGIARHTVLFYINVNRKRIFLVLCVFIMGTWVGSSFPYYHLSRHIPNLCNRVHDLETSTRITQPPPPPPPMTPSSATAKQANRHPNDHYAVTYEHTTTFPTTQPSSQSTSPSYTSKDDDHLVEVETQFPVETMRPTSTSDTSVPKIGSTVDSPTTNSYSNVPVSEDGSQSQTTVGHQWSTSSSNSSEGSAHNISKVSSKYLVDTSTCKIPKFNPRDPSLKNIINQVEPLDCGRPPLTYVEENVLFIHEKASVQYYGARNLSDVSCCYKVVKRKNVGQGSDDNYMLSKKCLPFVDKVHLQAEFVKVECTITNSNSSSVVDFHFTIPSNSKSSRTDGTFDDLPSTVMSENQKDRPFSVIMLGLDAVSRLNFERHLIQTRKFLLETLNAVELYGYNKVGDNTFPNLVPVLSGLSEPELSNLCWTNHNQPFDTCPWIWKKFKSQGYITMYGEDSTDISTFNYQKQGFRKKPTDFYLRPFLRAAEPSIGAVLSLNTHLCLGPRPLYQVTLEWAHQFMKTFSDQSYFGLVWSNSLTHDNEDFIQRADPFLHSMLHDLHVSKKLEDTFVILLSDHGIRWGALRETLIGRYEERLPMLYIIPPRRFRHNYPEAYENLQANSRRLTSPFDLYETLISILSLQENSTALSDFTSTYASRGSSLFKKISESRSCQNAGINPHWCACHETITLNVDIPEVVSTAYFIVSAINNITAPFADRCAVFQLDQVLGARRITNLQMHEGSLDDFYYVVTLRTFPGNAVFEATVRTSRNTSVVEGDISRVNLYSGTSECVSDSVIRKFCSCNS